MDLKEILKPVSLEPGYYDRFSLEELKAYHAKVIRPRYHLSETVPNVIRSDLQQVRAESVSLAMTVSVWQSFRGLYYSLFCADRELADRVHNHWLYRDLYHKLENMRGRGKVLVCKKCGFPFSRYAIRCEYCGEKDEEEYKILHEEIEEALRDKDEDEEEDLGCNEDTATDTSGPGTGHEIGSCFSCGAPLSGTGTCRYCGTLAGKAISTGAQKRKKARSKYRGARCPECGGPSEKVGMLCEGLQIRMCLDCSRQYSFSQMSEFIRQH